MSTQSKGKCNFCKKVYTKTSMQKHILACKERKHRHDIIENDKQSGYFGLSITGKYNKDYWLLIEVKEEATFKDIDKFLRDIWLECCDHLSSFKIDGTLYDSNPAPSMGWGQPVKSMNCKLKSILEKGMRFDYEYDFGSTTALTISVFDYRIGNPKKEKLTILSRNNPIEYICDECGEKIATSICPVCIYQDKSLFCDDCKENHDCVEEMLLRICNSPRFGVCGYDGSTKYPD